VTKRLHLAHFSVFRDARGRDAESVETHAETPRDLFDELFSSARGVAPSPQTWARVAINDDLAAWDALLSDGDTVVFLAPSAGG
jgi:molybdopterin converting factor small subunit